MKGQLVIKEASIAEAIAVQSEIPELGSRSSRERYEARLEGRRHLVLVAETDGRPVGYKVGYEHTPEVFYSWLGGVVPASRGRGVATALRRRQEAWARSCGYERLRVKSMNRFPSMLRLLVGAGYSIISTEGAGDDLKIVFEADLTSLHEPDRTAATR